MDLKQWIGRTESRADVVTATPFTSACAEGGGTAVTAGAGTADAISRRIQSSAAATTGEAGPRMMRARSDDVTNGASAFSRPSCVNGSVQRVSTSAGVASPVVDAASQTMMRVSLRRSRRTARANSAGVSSRSAVPTTMRCGRQASPSRRPAGTEATSRKVTSGSSAAVSSSCAAP